MAGTAEGAAKRTRCRCGAFAHPGPCGVPGPKARPILDRLWEKVTRGEPDECWTWNGHHAGPDRNRPQIDKQYVARVLMGLAPGDPQVVRHTCDNPRCVNPAHLLVGTQADNMQDMVGRGRSRIGERHHAAKLTTEQVEAIRNDPRPSSIIANDYPVNRRQISRIKSGERW